MPEADAMAADPTEVARELGRTTSGVLKEGISVDIQRSEETFCITIRGEDAIGIADALDRCRTETRGCPLVDMEVEHTDDHVRLTLRADDPEALQRIGMERCLRAVMRKTS
jgi:hypothetical protein